MSEEDVEASGSTYFSDTFLMDLLYRGTVFCVSHADSKYIKHFIEEIFLSELRRPDVLRIIGSTMGYNEAIYKRLSYSDMLRERNFSGTTADPTFYYEDTEFEIYPMDDPVVSVVLVPAISYDSLVSHPFLKLNDTLQLVAEQYAVAEALLILSKAELYDKIMKRTMDSLSPHLLYRFSTQQNAQTST